MLKFNLSDRRNQETQHQAVNHRASVGCECGQHFTAMCSVNLGPRVTSFYFLFPQRFDGGKWK